MKKLLLITFTALSLSASAQTEKGSWMLGTNFSNINFGFGENSSSNFTIGINPNMAYFMSDNFALGGTVNLLYSEKKDKDAEMGYGLQPLARYYFTKDEKSGIFGQASVGFLGTSTSGTSETGLTFSVGAGWNYFFSKYTALELGLRYTNTDKKVAGGAAGGFGGSAGLENNIGINFGIQVFLPKKGASHVKSSYKKSK